jgi:hypothetical protein
MKDTQHDMILSYLMTGARLNPIDALKWFGCFKLSTRIGEIERKLNIEVKRDWKKVKSKFGVKEFKEYYINPIPKV